MATIGLAGIGSAFVARKRAAAARWPVATATPPPLHAPAPAADPPLASTTPPRERTVALTIAPPNATVEVDGAPRDVVEGAIAITAAPGSIVSVRVIANGAETTQSVAITEGGAIPPKIVVTPPVASAAPTARPGTKPKPQPSATGTALNAQRNFE